MFVPENALSCKVNTKKPFRGDPERLRLVGCFLWSGATFAGEALIEVVRGFPAIVGVLGY